MSVEAFSSNWLRYQLSFSVSETQLELQTDKGEGTVQVLGSARVLGRTLSHERATGSPLWTLSLIFEK